MPRAVSALGAWLLPSRRLDQCRLPSSCRDPRSQTELVARVEQFFLVFSLDDIPKKFAGECICNLSAAKVCRHTHLQWQRNVKFDAPMPCQVPPH